MDSEEPEWGLSERWSKWRSDSVYLFAGGLKAGVGLVL